MITRAIPKTGELLPAVGLGTWSTFDVGAGAGERAPVREVLRRFFAHGGAVIDSSPMYGRAEEVVGDERPQHAKAFLATKVWTRGRRAGIEEMERSMRRMRATTIDLMQIHNLLDWKTHLPVLREHKAAGKIRYLGVTHYSHQAFDEMERILRDEDVDFVQLPYNLFDRAAEERLLPAARDTRTAVLVMRPFAEGALTRQLGQKPLPAWAKDAGYETWSQLLLAFVISHPAVTCAIPATKNPRHLDENMKVLTLPLPDAALREKMTALSRP